MTEICSIEAVISLSPSSSIVCHSLFILSQRILPELEFLSPIVEFRNGFLIGGGKRLILLESLLEVHPIVSCIVMGLLLKWH